jgi:signal transduction histidine kinase
LSSIRRAIIVRLVLGTAALLCCGTLGFYLGARALLTRQFDAVLRAKVDMLAALFEQEGPRVEFNGDAARAPEFDPGDAPEYFEAWLGEKLLVRSPSLAEGDLPRRFGPGDEALAFDIVLPDGRQGRAIGMELPIRDYERSLLGNPGPSRVTLVVARGRAELDAALLALLGGAAGGSVALLLGVLLLGARVADRGLAPVGVLVRHVEGIRDPTEAEAYPVAATAVELRPIAAGVNRLVERLAAELQRERRTAANIAHELRTPIAELLLLSDVALHCSDEPEHALEALRQVREISLEMRRLIGTLLELARLESGQLPLEPEPVELSALIEACWQPLADEARARGLAFELRGARPTVEADRSALAILCANLLSNAVAHAPLAARVECVLSNGPSTYVTISNPAGALSAADLDKLTEPFWRASAARGERGHAGLGLALARRLAELLQVELTFALEDGLFCARLGFAARPAGAAPLT